MWDEPLLTAGIVAGEVARWRCEEADVAQSARVEAGKPVKAVRLPAETTMTLRWIAARLPMGTPDYLIDTFRIANASRLRRDMSTSGTDPFVPENNMFSQE
ncbi:MAG: hypothetical protein H7A45_03855 [Verrucomicrobiales bacterium]|nr:hypothetical protein [Verrucomicrobiales bacterium]